MTIQISEFEWSLYSVVQVDKNNKQTWQGKKITRMIQKKNSSNTELKFFFFRNGLVYFDVPIDDNDYVIVPPLENFVMNRVLVRLFVLFKINIISN